MPWKLDDAGNVVSEGGKPIFIHPDGKEFGFDGDGTVATIGRLKDESRVHREGKEAALSELQPFRDAGLTDAVAAKKALDTVANFNAKDFVAAGDVEKIKAEAIKAVEAQWAPFKVESEQLKAQLRDEKIGGSFSRSKLIAEKFAIPADLVEARFGSRFDIEDGKIVAKDQAGNKIYSRARPGELADFDEALESLVEQYPYKDQILKGSGASGGGAGGGKGAPTGAKQMSRAAYDQLSATEQRTFAIGGGKLTD